MKKVLILYFLLLNAAEILAQNIEVIVPIGHKDKINKIITSLNNKIAVTGAGEYTRAQGCQGCIVKLWDIASSSELQSINGFDMPVTTLCLSNDANLLAAGSNEGQLTIWDIKNETKAFQLTCGKGLMYAFFSSDTRLLMTVGEQFKVWDVTTGNELSSITTGLQNVTAAAYNSQSGIVAVAGYPNQLVFFHEGKLLGNMELFNKDYSALAYNKEGMLITTGHDIDLSGVVTARLKITSPESQTVKTLHNLPDGKVVLSRDGGSTLVQTPNNILIYSWLLDKTFSIKNFDNVSTVGFSADGRMLLIAYTKSGKQQVSMVSTGNSSVISQLRGHAELPLTASFGRQDSVININYSNRVIRWNLKTGQIDNFSQKNVVKDVAVVSTDQKLTLKNSGRDIRLYRNSDKKLLKTFKQIDSIYTMKFLQSGKFFITGGIDKTARLWEVDKGLVQHTFRGHSSTVNIVVVSPDEHLLATASIDQTIKIWEINTGKLVSTLTGHEQPINTLEFSAKGNYLISTSTDYTTRLWNLDSQKECARFYALDSTDYMINTLSGYYMSTTNAAKELRFKANENIFSFSQFDLQFNRPDKVLENLGTVNPLNLSVYQHVADKRIRRMGFDPQGFVVERSSNVPEINIVNRAQIPVSTIKRTINISCLVHDALYNLNRLNVYVNGVPLYGVSGLSLKSKRLKTIKQELNFRLSTGGNLIEVSAINDHGVESRSEQLKIEYAGIANKPNLYIVTIGISKYHESNKNLHYAAKDATDFSAFFNSPQHEFGKIIYLSLLDQNVTKDKVLALKNTLSSSTEDDQVILFYAGHGLASKELDYYLSTYDMDFSKPQVSGILYTELEGILDGIPARKKIMFIDACHSGEIDKEDTRLDNDRAKHKEDIGFRGNGQGLSNVNNSAVIMNQFFVDLRIATGTTVIASAGPAEYAFEGTDWNNGAFTYSMLHGLMNHSADLDHNGRIMLSELLYYVIKQVPQLTKGLQHPVCRMENLVNDLYIWQ